MLQLEAPRGRPRTIWEITTTLHVNKNKKMLSLTSVSASEVVIGDVADKFKLPCQRVHAVTVAVCRWPDSNRRWRLADTGFESNKLIRPLGHHASCMHAAHVRQQLNF